MSDARSISAPSLRCASTCPPNAAFSRQKRAICGFATDRLWSPCMVQAALKAVPLGQSAGQRILATLVDEIPGAIDRAAALQDSERQAFTPMLAILSAQHEVQYSRLFRS